MWHEHPDFYMNKLEEILNTPNDNDNDYFAEVDLKNPDNIKEKTKKFRFVLRIKIFLKINIMNI